MNLPKPPAGHFWRVNRDELGNLHVELRRRMLIGSYLVHRSPVQQTIGLTLEDRVERAALRVLRDEEVVARERKLLRDYS